MTGHSDEADDEPRRAHCGPFLAAAFLVASLLVGCAGFLNPAADGVITLRGTVVGVPADSPCLAQLHERNGKLVQEVAVPPAFSRSLVVAPGHRRYYVEIGCPDWQGRFRSEVYDTHSGTVIE